jgi:hypothetical protein
VWAIRSIIRSWHRPTRHPASGWRPANSDNRRFRWANAKFAGRPAAETARRGRPAAVGSGLGSTLRKPLRLGCGARFGSSTPKSPIGLSRPFHRRRSDDLGSVTGGDDSGRQHHRRRPDGRHRIRDLIKSAKRPTRFAAGRELNQPDGSRFAQRIVRKTLQQIVVHVGGQMQLAGTLKALRRFEQHLSTRRRVQIADQILHLSQPARPVLRRGRSVPHQLLDVAPLLDQSADRPHVLGGRRMQLAPSG